MSIDDRRMQFARELADPDWSLSVPEPAKDVIRDLVAEIERLRVDEWEAGRLWRAVDAGGYVWAESSNEQEVRRRALPSHRLYRQWRVKSRTKWVEVAP